MIFGELDTEWEYDWGKECVSEVGCFTSSSMYLRSQHSLKVKQTWLNKLEPCPEETCLKVYMLILRNEKMQPMTLIEFYWEFLTLKFGGIDPVNSIPAPWASLRGGHPFYDWLQSFNNHLYPARYLSKGIKSLYFDVAKLKRFTVFCNRCHRKRRIGGARP